MKDFFCENCLQTIGNTPLIRLSRLESAFACPGRIYGKAEYLNPSGSVKDRAALFVIKGALEKCILSLDSTVIACTAGNSAVSIAMVCGALGLSCVIILPDDAPEEKRRLAERYGAKILPVPSAEGAQGAAAAAEKLRAKLKNAVTLDLFENDDNAEAHRQTTGPEILRALPQVGYFVAGIGTGGTITGCGEYIKRHSPEVKIIGVEPADSPVISGGFPAAHTIAGIGAGFVPPILNSFILDGVMRVRTPDAFEMCRLLAKTEAIYCGPSAGAALTAAVNTAQKPEAAGKNIVCILPDRGELYAK